MMMKDCSDYPFELQCVDAGACIRAGFYFYGRAYSNYRIACTRGFTQVRLIRRRDNKVLFSKSIAGAIQEDEQVAGV